VDPRKIRINELGNGWAIGGGCWSLSFFFLWLRTHTNTGGVALTDGADG